MKNLVLLQPEIGDMDYLRTHPSLPLGLLHASSLVAQKYEIRILDQRLDKKWEYSLSNMINRDTVLVGVTSFTGPMILESIKMCVAIRNINNVPIVWGGVHPSLLSENTLRDSRVDIVIRGEGEVTLLELTESLSKGNSLENIKGISYRRNGTIKSNPEREFLDLDLLPDLPYHLIDVNQYLPLYRGQKSFYFQASRGCPSACTFCYNANFNRRKWRKISAGRVIARLQAVKINYSIENIYFVDDNFFLDLDWCKEIMMGLKNLGLSWQVQGVDVTSLKRMDDDFLASLVESGCLRITLGVESGSPRIRKLMGKEETVAEISEQISRLKTFPLSVYCSFIVGFPGEDEEDLQLTLRLILGLKQNNPWVQISPLYSYTPYPGTSMFETAALEGYDIPDSLEGWGKTGGWDHEKKYRSGRGKNPKLTKLYFLSNFLDRKAREYNVPWWVNLIVSIYRPVAEFRIRFFFLDFMFEEKLARLIKSGWIRMRKLGK